ncbi:hypothetical protein MMC29_007233 [Sticta canariensis]|nr:hypothetical protein [Sticta canariensis]
MCKRNIARAESMVHPEHARTVADLMLTFDPNQTGHTASSKMRHDVGRALDEAEYARESLHQGVHKIDLLQRRFDTAEKIPLLLLNLGPYGIDPTLILIVLLWKGTEAEQFENTDAVYKKGETENKPCNNLPRNINTPELTSDSPTGQSRQIVLSYRRVLNVEFWLAVVELVQEPSANNVGEIIMPGPRFNMSALG